MKLDRKGLGDFLKRVRKERAPTQKRFAEELGIDQGNLSKAERGELPRLAGRVLARIGYRVERRETWHVEASGKEELIRLQPSDIPDSLINLSESDLPEPSRIARWNPFYDVVDSTLEGVAAHVERPDQSSELRRHRVGYAARYELEGPEGLLQVIYLWRDPGAVWAWLLWELEDLSDYTSAQIYVSPEIAKAM